VVILAGLRGLGLDPCCRCIGAATRGESALPHRRPNRRTPPRSPPPDFPWLHRRGPAVDTATVPAGSVRVATPLLHNGASQTRLHRTDMRKCARHQGNNGTPGGTRTPDPQVRRPIATQEMTRACVSRLASSGRWRHIAGADAAPRLYPTPDFTPNRRVHDVEFDYASVR
jgi:hypothetical protein